MRIAVVNNFFPPRVGGSSHLSHSLAVGYAAAGHEVIVLTASYDDAPAYEEVDGLKIFRIQAVPMPATRLAISFDMAFTLRPSLPRTIAEHLDAFRPDVIHQHGQFFDLTWASGAWAARNKVPTLLSVHTRLESPTPAYSRVFRMLDSTVVAPILRRYKPTFVVMDIQMREYITKRYRKAIGGLVDIPVGVAPDEQNAGPVDIRARHNLAPETPIVLSIGHVIQMRDRVSLIEALPKLRERVPNAKVIIVGRVYVDHFQTRAQELGVDDMVLSVGPQPREQVAEYLAAATVESHDLQGYGLGTASLESMAAGVPVVAAVRPDNFAGIELISGENCFLVAQNDPADLADALITAITQPELARKVGHNGRQLVEKHFTLSAVLDAHITALSELVAGKQA